MPVRLFVGNLPYETTETELREFFSPVGTLSNVIIPVDRETGKRRGFAFVEFSDAAQAEEASRRFNNQPFKGRNITINEARARESRPDAGRAVKPSLTSRSVGLGNTPRPMQAARTSFSPPDFTHDPMENGRAARAERRSRNFGPDARPARKRKNNYEGKSYGESGWKKSALRDRIKNQSFDDYDDSYDDADLDYMNFANDTDEEDAG